MILYARRTANLWMARQDPVGVSGFGALGRGGNAGWDEETGLRVFAGGARCRSVQEIPPAGMTQPLFRRRCRGPAGVVRLCAWVTRCWLLFASLPVQAATSPEVQLDLQVGYQGVVRVGSWVPVVVEAYNPGAHFRGVLELEQILSGWGSSYRLPFELPQGTRKRLQMPAFCRSAYTRDFKARLVSEDRRKVVHESGVVAPRYVLEREVPWAMVVGRSFSSAPGNVGLPRDRNGPHWTVVRPEELPESPLLWEAVDGLYLSSERARELSAAQVAALRAWLYRGGHLMVGVAEAEDVDYAPWLRELLPVEVVGMLTLSGGEGSIRWERDPVFGSRTEMLSDATDSRGEGLSATIRFCEARAAEPLVRGWLEQWPLVVSDARGRGKVTVVLCDLERQPWRSWFLRSNRWHGLWGGGTSEAERTSQSKMPRDRQSPEETTVVQALQTDQIRSLPWVGVVALLVLYVILIGPVDYRWTRRSRRPMMTWVRLPVYAMLFAGTIYFISYRYRAGVSEWNELNLVDVDLGGPPGMVRGWTFVSLYSARNQRYPVGAPHVPGSVREPSQDAWASWQDDRRSTLRPSGPGWEGEIFVPVWTSRDWVYEWYAELESPVQVQARRHSMGWTLEVQNRLPQSLEQVWVVAGSEVCRLVPVGPRQNLQLTALAPAMIPRTAALEEVRRSLGPASHPPHGWRASRQPRMGLAEAAVLASLGIEPVVGGPGGGLSRGLALPEDAPDDHVWLLAWAKEHRPLPMMAGFRPARVGYGTLYRIRVPLSRSRVTSYESSATSSRSD